MKHTKETIFEIIPNDIKRRDVNSDKFSLSEFIEKLKKAEDDGANEFSFLCHVDCDGVVDVSIQTFLKRLETDKEFEDRIERIANKAKIAENQKKTRVIEELEKYKKDFPELGINFNEQ